MVSFKQFLLEGGHATADQGTGRVSKAQVEQALAAVAKALKLPIDDVKGNALGSIHLVLSGHKKDAGDIDIAAPLDKMEAFDKLMRTKFEGVLNKGTSVGSYAVPVDGGKVQVDLMFSPDIEWAKFIYSSEQGRKSAYPGAVRNLLMMTAVAHTHKPGEDYVMKDGDQVVARASRSLKLQGGLERLFKQAKFNEKTGKFNKGLDKVDPEELHKFLNDMTKGGAKFSKEADPITNPKAVVQWLFGKGVSPSDVETAEQVITHIKKLPNAREIIADAKEQLAKAKLPIPKEL